MLAITKDNLNIRTLALKEKEEQYLNLSKQVKGKTELLGKLEKELHSVIQQRNEQAKRIALLSQQYKEINQKLASAQGDITKLQQTKEKLAIKIADLEQTRSQLTQEVAAKEELAKRLSLGLEIVREGNITFRAGEVLSSQVIQGGSVPEVEEQLKRLILDANQLALQRGAKPGNDGETAIWLSRGEVDEVLKTLTSSKKSMVVRLLCASNTVLEEPVVVNFQLFENKKIFSKGELVLEDKIDGTQPENIVEGQLIGMLQRVNMAAVKKGVIPDPLRGTIGSVQALEIYNTVKKVKDINKEVTVSVIALDDTNVADSLKVRLQVKK